MPFKSESQRRWMFSKKPEMAKEWAEDTPDMKGLPDKKKKKTHVRISDLGAGAAARAMKKY